MARAGRSPTQQDVAALAGVSRALVSIVFRGAPGAGGQTRERVLAAAAELGYQPDHRARLLGRNRTGLIGVSFGVRLAFHADLVEALYAAADAVGYDLVLSGVTPTRPEPAAVDALLAYRCEALVLLGPTLPAARLAQVAAAAPTVVVAQRSRVPGVDAVRIDDADGIRRAVTHLLDLGHERIAHVDGGRAPGAADRRRGYRTALRRAGLGAAEVVVPGGLTEDDGARAAGELLDLPVLPSGVAAFNDRCAVGVLHTLRTAGVAVPDQVSVVGFDDDRLAALPHIDLTTVRQDPVELAGRAIGRALERIAALSGAHPAAADRDVVIPPMLITRGTTAAPPG